MIQSVNLISSRHLQIAQSSLLQISQNLHNVGSQFAVALAATLTVPVHSHYQQVVNLPRPFETGTVCGKRSLSPHIYLIRRFMVECVKIQL